MQENGPKVKNYVITFRNFVKSPFDGGLWTEGTISLKVEANNEQEARDVGKIYMDNYDTVEDERVVEILDIKES